MQVAVDFSPRYGRRPRPSRSDVCLIVVRMGQANVAPRRTRHRNYRGLESPGYQHGIAPRFTRDETAVLLKPPWQPTFEQHYH